EPVQQGNGLLDHPPVGAEPGAVCGAAAGDAGTDAFGVHPPAMAVVVVAAVGVDGLWASSGPPASSPYRWDGVDQRDELGDVVAVAAGEADGQRDARALGDHVVFRAGPGAVDRARTGFGPPLSARTWELSITALDQSSFWAACSLRKQQLVQPLPDPGGVPLGQPAPAGHPRAKPQFLRQELPRDTGVKHEQDPAQHPAVVQPLATGVAVAPLHLRQQRLYTLPQPVRDYPRRLLTLAHDRRS